MIKAQEILESEYGVGADVWSVTSYTELYRDGHAVRALEHAASGGETPRRAARHAVPERRTRRAGGGVRLCQGAARLDRQAGCRGR